MSSIRGYEEPAPASGCEFAASNGKYCSVVQLTKGLAEMWGPEFLEIHNQIPYVRWDLTDLLSDRSSTGTVYLWKFSLSSAVFVDGVPIGLLVAYFRGSSDRHPLQGVYIHRLAIRRDFQRMGVGRSLTSYAVDSIFSRMPTLPAISVQTNDEQSNQGVIGFYLGLGFRVLSKVRYPEKVDLLLELPRERWAQTLD